MELLEVTKSILSASIVYVLDKQGTVTASSTTPFGKRLTGENFTFRPYFKNAIKGEEFRYAALGVSTQQRGIYFSAPIYDHNSGKTNPLGVVVIKADIHDIQVELENSPFQHVALLSDNGIIFVVSQTDKEWLFHAGMPLSLEEKEALRKSRQFEKYPLNDLPISLARKTTSINGVTHSIQKVPVALEGWYLVSLEHQAKKYPLVLLILFPALLLSHLFIAKLIAHEKESALKKEMKEEILERKSIQKQLQKAKEEAEAATIVKSNFLANVSHEIRTPMNGIMGLTGLLLSSELTAKQRKHLEMINSSAKRLLALVNDLLDYSKIESGKMELEEIPFVLTDKLEEVRSLMAPKAKGKQVNLAIRFLNKMPDTLIGDPAKLMQILINLVNNGLKFTEKGSVTILVQCNKNTAGTVLLQFGIRDTGIGIPKDKQEIIFDSFCQADSSTNRKYGGTGLGLTISSQLVQLLGGEIWLESGTGKGTTFWFTARFGVSRTQENPHSTDGTAEDCSEDRKQLLKNRRILLAEDELINMYLASTLLEREEMIVETAANGREALDKFLSKHFDCILMDIQMPEFDGYQTTAAIRQHEKQHGGHIPIIAMTANAMQGARKKCEDAGMDDYITKPLNSKEVYSTIEKLLTTFSVQYRVTSDDSVKTVNRQFN